MLVRVMMMVRMMRVVNDDDDDNVDDDNDDDNVFPPPITRLLCSIMQMMKRTARIVLTNANALWRKAIPIKNYFLGVAKNNSIIATIFKMSRKAIPISSCF